MIPISKVDVGEEAERLVLEVLRSGRLAQGPMVERLEHSFTKVAGTEFAVAVSSGTVALVASLQALELGPGVEVVTSPFTFAATLNAILEAGATAKFADIGEDFTIDPERLAEAIGPRTRVIMPVHLYGLPADMEVIERFAMDNGASIVEDAAQAIGAQVERRPIGSFGLGCFSLYATKNVTTGEGGVVTTNDSMIDDRLRLLRGQGMRDRYRYEIPGHNYRMTEVQAAIGIPQLERLEEITRRRQENADLLTEGLSGLEGVLSPVVPRGRTHVFHQYTLRITAGARVGRDQAVRELRGLGIACGIYYPRVVFDYDCYRTHPRVIAGSMPKAELAARQVLSLPVYPALSESDVGRTIEAVRLVFGA